MLVLLVVVVIVVVMVVVVVVISDSGGGSIVLGALWEDCRRNGRPQTRLSNRADEAR